MAFKEGCGFGHLTCCCCRWQKDNVKVGKEAREVKKKSKQIVAEGLKRNEKDRRGWKRRRGEGDR